MLIKLFHFMMRVEIIFLLFIGLVHSLTTPETTRKPNRHSTRLQKVLHLLQADPKLNFPVLKLQKALKPTKLSHCYDSTIGGHEVNIFNVTLGNVVKKFFKIHHDLLQNDGVGDVRRRIRTVLNNIRFIARHVFECVMNQANPNYVPVRIGLTPFTFYTDKEFKDHFLLPSTNKNRTHPVLRSNHIARCKIRIKRDQLPAKWDWRKYRPSGKKYSVVTPVKHQGQCGLCYVFAAVGAMESAFLLSKKNKKRRQIRFSEQALLNCLPRGCGGGYTNDVFFAAQKRGLTFEKKSRYRAKKMKCKQYQSVARPTGFCVANLRSDIDLQSLVYQYGPAVTNIHGNNRLFKQLRGPWTRPCDSNRLDHSMLTVGYTKTHWIVKNSWGPHWGVKGYLHLPRHNANSCGFIAYASVAHFNMEHNGVH